MQATRASQSALSVPVRRLQPATSAGQLSVTHFWHGLGSQVPLPAQVPVAEQTSLLVQVLPSLQDAPVATGLVQTPVEGWQVPAVWHWSVAAQVFAVPVQVPARQLSPSVHRFASLQAVASGATGFVQMPVAGWQTPAVWHWSEAAQVLAVPAVQVPARQVSPSVHAFASLQTVASGAAGFEQAPVAGLQVPATWHWSEAAQVTGVPVPQTPMEHISAPLQALLSLQDVPDRGEFTQVPLPPHESAVQGFWSSQLPEGPAVQAPAWQVLAPPHWVAGAQTVPLATLVVEQPVVGLQRSAVHELLSLQVSAVPAAQTPARQTSAPLQTLASAQDPPSLPAVLVQTPAAF